MTGAQLKALYCAASWWVEDKTFLGEWMQKHAGPQWRKNLRKALAEVSRELAKVTFTKRRK